MSVAFSCNCNPSSKTVILCNSAELDDQNSLRQMCVCHFLTSRDRTKIIQTLSDAFGHLAPGRFDFLASISVFMEYALLQAQYPFLEHFDQDGIRRRAVCRPDEALLQRRTRRRGVMPVNFGRFLSTSLSSRSTKRTPSTLALPPFEGPQSMHAAL